MTVGLLRPSCLTFLVLSACDSAAPADPQAAEASVQAALASDSSYRRALEFEAFGRHVEAQVAVENAIAAGAGRDAKLLAIKLAILRGDLDAAAGLAAPLAAADPNDADVQYNLGLVAQRKGDYNRARSAYLAALRADSRYAAARYNVAILAWDAGVQEEARHHARRLLEVAPEDPRAQELRQRFELDAAPTR